MKFKIGRSIGLKNKINAREGTKKDAFISSFATGCESVNCTCYAPNKDFNKCAVK